MWQVSYTLNCAVQFPIPSLKRKFATSLTEDINAKRSHWNNGKVNIAYNSAYVQIETCSFTFIQQALIVYFYLCSNFQEITILMPNIKLRNDHCRRVQSLIHGYTAYTPQCHMHAICYIELSDSPPKENNKFAPFLPWLTVNQLLTEQQTSWR